MRHRIGDATSNWRGGYVRYSTPASDRIAMLPARTLQLHFSVMQASMTVVKPVQGPGRLVMPKGAYRVLHRVGRQLANGRLCGTSTYKGICAFLRRKLVEDEVVESCWRAEHPECVPPGA